VRVPQDLDPGDLVELVVTGAEGPDLEAVHLVEAA
jgi:hypothetical protein